MAKKKKTGQKKPDEQQGLCKVCNNPLANGQVDTCSDACEIAFLKSKLAEKDEKLDRLTRKNKPERCYGRVVWSTCVQEWYSQRSFDAKRRAQALRKLGFNCDVKGLGPMPILNGAGEELVKMTVLTCHLKVNEEGEPEAPPEPEQIVKGLQGEAEAESLQQ